MTWSDGSVTAYEMGSHGALCCIPRAADRTHTAVADWIRVCYVHGLKNARIIEQGLLNPEYIIACEHPDVYSAMPKQCLVAAAEYRRQCDSAAVAYPDPTWLPTRRRIGYYLAMLMHPERMPHATEWESTVAHLILYLPHGHVPGSFPDVTQLTASTHLVYFQPQLCYCEDRRRELLSIATWYVFVIELYCAPYLLTLSISHSPPLLCLPYAPNLSISHILSIYCN